MHPDPAFRPNQDALIDRAAAIAFAHVFVSTPKGPMVVHAPVTRHGRALRFHVSRGNRAVAHLAGAQVLASVAGVDGYITPNWYDVPGDQVPTWNYEAVEIEGWLTALDETALVEQLDALAAVHEPRVIPENPWTRAKVDPAEIARLLRGIRGFELVPDAVRGTAKLSQNKTAADRERVVAGLRRVGLDPLADAVERA